MKALLYIMIVLTSLGVGEAFFVSQMQTVKVPLLEEPLFRDNEPMYSWIKNPPNISTITWERNTFKIKEELDAYMKQNPERGNVVGLAEIRGKRCKIYAPEPMIDGDYYSYILAHEISHCFGMRHD